MKRFERKIYSTLEVYNLDGTPCTDEKSLAIARQSDKSLMEAMHGGKPNITLRKYEGKYFVVDQKDIDHAIRFATVHEIFSDCGVIAKDFEYEPGKVYRVDGELLILCGFEDRKRGNPWESLTIKLEENQ